MLMRYKNPDIIHAFFGCMEMIAQHFAGVLFDLESHMLDNLMYFTVRALALQERYSLVSACKFLVCCIVPMSDLQQKD